MANGSNDTFPIQTELFPKYIIFTFGVLLFTICIFGLVGNTLSIAIFVGKNFRTLSINIYLAAMSVADICLLTLAIPLYAIGPLLIFCKNRDILEFHATLSIRLYPIAYIFHCCSIWLLVVVTIDRWLAVCRPFSAAMDHRIFVIRALKVTGGILAMSILFNLCRFWEISIEFNPEKNVTEPVMKLRKNSLYLLLYVSIGNITFIYVIPFFVMIFFITRIYLGISKYRRCRRKISTSERDDNQINRMLRFVVICYICCYMPPFILNILEPINPEFFDRTIGYILSVANNVLVLLNASTTFLFYFNFSSRYRRQAKLIFATLTCASAEELQLLMDRSHLVRLYENLNRSPSISMSRRSVMDSRHNSITSRTHSFVKAKRLKRQYSVDQLSDTSRKSSTTPSSSRSFWSVRSKGASSSSDRQSSMSSGMVPRNTKRTISAKPNVGESLHRQVSIRLMADAFENLKHCSPKQHKNTPGIRMRSETTDGSMRQGLRKTSVRFKIIHSDIEICDV